MGSVLPGLNREKRMNSVEKTIERFFRHGREGLVVIHKGVCISVFVGRAHSMGVFS
ncbi:MULTISPECIES: hypothetical protein [unclassified Bartonella]|uniref:hypothetical protein n=1 Tax=unclassified Bartonella TaxID=2645622 RepID=UPI002361E48A|nr:MULTISPECIES: hypothetical protein [unclassified Bartonella]